MSKKSSARDEGGSMVVAGTSEDEQIAAEAGQAVVRFLKGLSSFFTTARAIERGAEHTLEDARALRLPASSSEDVSIQRFAKQASIDRKAAEEHWQITSVVSQFHKRLVAARKRATDPLEQANAIGNDLHNRYVQAEQRRAREEQERLDREAEERARLAREQELADLEAAAIRAEEGSPDLSARERTFVDLYFATGNGTTSAQRAGFKKPMAEASRLLTLPKIQAAIQAKREAAALRQKHENVRTMPLEVSPVEEVRPDVMKAPGLTDRTTYSAEIFDRAAFVQAAVSGRYGIPLDTLMPAQTQLNEYARSMHELINRWPGIRLKSKTGVV